MSRWEDLKKQLGDSFQNAVNPQIQPGDETLPANNLRNLAVDKLGLPQEWTQTVAEEKQHIKDLPMNMGMSGGTIGKASSQAAAHITPEIIQLAQKAKGMGIDALNAAEQLLLKKAANKLNGKSESVLVKSSKQDIAGDKALENMSKPVDVREIAEPTVTRFRKMFE